MGMNPLAVILAAAGAMGVGFLWYSPMLFGKQWLEYSGLSAAHVEAAKKKGMAASYAGAAAASLVTAWALAYFLDRTGTLGLGQALVRSTIAWAGFVATTLAGALFFERKPFNLFVINSGHHLAAFWVMGLILVSFR